MAEPPAPEEMWEEILLRLPPDDPTSLLRASVVCKLWRRIVYRRGFLRRLAQLHRAPPMLGFFERPGGFVPTTAGSAFSLPAPVPDSSTWSDVLDCRHGRVLLLHASSFDLLVWEPITGYQRRVPFPGLEDDWETFNAAVVCAADGCDHWSCHGGPFRVVEIWASGGADSFASAMEYSSETGAWSQPTTIPIADDSNMPLRPTLLMGNCLYFLCDNFEIIRYDLRGQGQLTVIPTILMMDPIIDYGWGVTLMQAEDGELGLAGVELTTLHLWSWQTTGLTDGDAGAAGWVLRRTIDLKNLLPATALGRASIEVIGFVEGTDVILMETLDGVFAIELKSSQAKVCASSKASAFLPFLSFYTPGMQANAGE